MICDERCGALHAKNAAATLGLRGLAIRPLLNHGEGTDFGQTFGPGPATIVQLS